MKKILWIAVILFPIAALAEGVQLVTVLPSPVGSFARLDTASKTRANFPLVTFGNENAAGGTIEVTGGQGIEIKTINLAQDTTLKSDTSSLLLVGEEALVTVQSGATLKGGRLFAQVFKVKRLGDSNTGLRTTYTLYPATSLQVKAASVSNLSLTHDTSNLTTIKDRFLVLPGIPALGTPQTFCWTNKYRTGPLGTNSSTYYKQFLLTADSVCE